MWRQSARPSICVATSAGPGRRLGGVVHDGRHGLGHLCAEDRAQLLGGNLVGDRRPQQHDQQLVGETAFPELDPVPDQRLAEVLARHRRQVGKLQVDVGSRGEEAVLAAVVAHDHRRVDARVRGDRRGSSCARSRRPRSGAGRPSGSRPASSSDRGENVMPTSVGQRVLTDAIGFGTVLVNKRWQTTVGRRRSDMTELPRTTDVLIVGAGPVGLTLAASLRSRGVDVVARRQGRRGGEHVAGGRDPRPDAGGAAMAIDVSDELVRRGIDRPALHGPRPRPSAADDRLRRAAHSPPVHADAAAGHHRGRAERAASTSSEAGCTARTSWRACEQDARRRDRHHGRRRDRPSLLRRRRGRHAQRGPRPGRHRLRRRQLRRSRSCSPTCTWTGSSTTPR